MLPGDMQMTIMVHKHTQNLRHMRQVVYAFAYHMSQVQYEPATQFLSQPVNPKPYEGQHACASAAWH